MSAPIKPYVHSVTWKQCDADGYCQTLTAVIGTEGAGHYVQLITNDWDMDVEEVDTLARELNMLVARADMAWDEAFPAKEADS